MGIGNFELRAGRNLLRQPIDLTPGEVRVNQAKEQFAKLEGLEFISRVVESNDALHSVFVSLETPDGCVEFVQYEPSCSGSWRTEMVERMSGKDVSYYVDRAQSVARLLPMVLDQTIALIPWNHVPRVSLNDLPPEHQGLLREVMPEVFDLSEDVQGSFAALLYVVAHDLKRAKKLGADLLERDARRKRLSKQFRTLPTGTVLFSNGRRPEVGIISDQRGSRTKRSLNIRNEVATYTRDLDRHAQERFKLLTQDRAKEVPRGLMSAHEVVQAVSRTRELAAQCPDLV